jgi:hypothetical protein
MCKQCDYKSFNFNDSKKAPILSDDVIAAVLILLWDDNNQQMLSIIEHAWKTQFAESDAAGVAMMNQIAKASAQASHLGRQRAGEKSDFNQSDIDFGKMSAAQQSQYINNFMRDVKAGRYGSTDNAFDSTDVKQNQIINRAAMHSNHLIAVANERFALALGDNEKIWWELGGNENHCEDCPALAEASPYTKNTLPTYPREGDTQCMSFCYCYLHTEDGKKSFMPLPQETS